MLLFTVFVRFQYTNAPSCTFPRFEKLLFTLTVLTHDKNWNLKQMVNEVKCRGFVFPSRCPTTSMFPVFFKFRVEGGEF